jgi:multicomponent Na+:H+ antiporter subunit C
MDILPFLVSGWVFLVGLYGIVTSRNLVHTVICLTVAQSSTYVLLIAVGYVSHAAAPIYAGQAVGTPAVDPVVQALSLVDIVVEATVSALLLAMAVQADKRFGTIDPERLRPLRG